MVGGGSRRDGGPLKINSTNVFAVLETLKKKKKSDKESKSKGASKNQGKEQEKQVFWALAPLTSMSWANVGDDDNDDYYATTAPPQAVWGVSEQQHNKKVEETIEENHEMDRGGRNTAISDSGHGRDGIGMLVELHKHVERRGIKFNNAKELSEKLIKLHKIPLELEDQVEPEFESEFESLESTFEPDSEESDQTDFIALMAKEEIAESEFESGSYYGSKREREHYRNQCLAHKIHPAQPEEKEKSIPKGKKHIECSKYK
ncbi:uncharacterized protein LOC121972272 [Zingiber officinale]|uniref:uncharacterized protein LOC121972272 n=1 Tax=Zingiber officinale TaxID=94328 RepID=UPI001C4B67DC|nr:uncharacterized protein LOC121972272 [Zingiber officinale]